MHFQVLLINKDASVHFLCRYKAKLYTTCDNVTEDQPYNEQCPSI